MSARWTEGVCGDGAAILRDGVMVPIEEVVEALNTAEIYRPEFAGLSLELLAQGLDLCVRARKMDAMDLRTATLTVSIDGDAWEKSGRFDQHVARHNIVNPDQPIATRSGTVHLWLQEQYEHDLADWERRVRQHLMQVSR